VDEEVEPREPGEDLLHETPGRSRFAEVGPERLGPGPEGPEGGDGLGGRGRVAAVMDCDVVPAARGPLGERASEAAGGSGHEGDGSHAGSVSPPLSPGGPLL
jgi:hypothetical protein